MRLLQGDVRAMLATLAADSVHCVITSVPYWGLRAYGTEPQVWGGREDCKHIWSDEIPGDGRRGQRGGSSIMADRSVSDHQVNGRQVPKGTFCLNCNAWRGEHGQEPTPQLYVAHEVEIWRAVRRVLRPDGVAWLNIGDSYTGSNNTNIGGNANFGSQPGRDSQVNRPQKKIGKPKDLCLIPERLAIALQDDGWWIRSRVPWVKRSAMPDSTTDRPGVAVEYWWMLTKRARYFWDAAAVRQMSIPRASNMGRPRRVGHNKHAERNQHSEGGFVDSGGDRNFRDADLLFQSLAPPHGLISDAEGNPLALDVNTAGFSGAQFLDGYDGGSGRIRSSSCPLHGDQDHRAPTASDGGRQAASRSAHTRRTSRRHEQLPPGGLFPTETLPAADSSHGNSDLQDRECSRSATARSNQTCKTDPVPETSPHGTTAAGSASGTDDNASRPEKAATSSHTRESNSGRDFDADEQQNCLSEQTAASSAGKCTCRIIDHFATFPPRLIEPLIKASTSERGCCPACGAPWVRVMEKGELVADAPGYKPRGNTSPASGVHVGMTLPGSDQPAPNHHYETKTIDWRPSCACPAADPVPCTVLDPFGGAGTTGLVADRLGRDAVLIELQPDYAEMARRRIAGDAPLFAEVR